MKKTLNVTAIANELKGESLFFAAPASKSKATPPSLPSPRTTRTTEHPNDRTAERANTRTSERPNARTAERANGRTAPTKPPGRPIVRHSFQFYRDQIAQLKLLRAQKELQGEPCHLSDLVREALDTYLQRMTDDANGRTPERANGRTAERANT